MPRDREGSWPELDAPVKVERQVANPLPMPWSTDATMQAQDRRRRTDASLLRQLKAVLAEHDIDGHVEVDVMGALVSLRGIVADVLTCQLVEDLAWSVPAVVHLDNQLRVVGPS